MLMRSCRESRFLAIVCDLVLDDPLVKGVLGGGGRGGARAREYWLTHETLDIPSTPITY